MIRWYVEVHDPRVGDDLGHEVEASDAEDAQTIAAEELAEDTDLPFDVVSTWVGTATRIPRYA
jgi:hypothetical protein